MSRCPLVNCGVFGHSIWRLASACFLVSALAACSSGDTTDNDPFGGTGQGGGSVQVDECDVVADCDADLASSGFDPACVEVTCEDHQCRFTGGPLNGGSCDDGSACTVNDVCDSRVCVGTPDPDNSCDDGDACTLDTCDAETGECDNAIAVGQSCDDEVACTNQDMCDVTGACHGVPTESCECIDDDHCEDLNPEDKCEATFVCQADYSCAVDPSTAVTCDALTTDCTVGECIPETGECVGNPVNEAAACTDDNPCLEPGTGICGEGSCLGDEIECDDNDPCTTDSCDSDAGGCVHEVAQGELCDDDDPCTEADACLADGSCHGTAVSCDDDELCTEDSCVPETGACINTPTSGECNDTDPCTVDDACLGGFCQGTPKDCDDGNACTENICLPNTGTCIHSAAEDQSPCDLDDPCSAQDFCQSGICISGEALCECAADEDCEDYNSDDPCSPDYFCQVDVMPRLCVPDLTTAPQCEPSDVPCMLHTCVSETGECAMVAGSDGLGCDDGDPCSLDGFCYNGSCATTPIDCEDGYPCTANLCLDAGCYTQLLTEGEKLLEAAFDQGLPEGWTQESDHDEVYWAPSGAYAEGEGGLGMVVTGPGGNYAGPVEAWLRSPWFHVYGEELEMRYKVQTGLAQAGCGTDVLRVGIEAYGLFTPLQVVCQTQTEWTDMWIDLSEYRNQKVQVVFLFVANDTQNAGFGVAIDGVEIDAIFSCVDEDACTTGETCQEGECELFTDTCDDDDGCTLDTCSPDVGCVHTPQDECGCELPTDCPYVGLCAVPTCTDGICGTIDIDEGACDTGDACSANGTCQEGLCVGEPVSCDDDNICTDDLCDSEVGCQFPPNEASCDDGDACTDGDLCAGGVCAGTPKDCDTASDCSLGTCLGGECYAEALHDGMVQIGDDFDGLATSDLPPDWFQETSDPAWSWSPDTSFSASAPNALAVTGPLMWGDEPVVLRLESPEFTIPAGGANLNFMLSMALGDETCDGDTLTISVGDEQVHVACESTPAFMEVTVPLPQASGPVTALFEVALTGDSATFVDIRLDDIEVLANYPCDLDDPCSDGVCVVGTCVTEPVPNCN